MSYLRIATHPRIFAAPLSPDEAFGNVSALLALREDGTYEALYEKWFGTP